VSGGANGVVVNHDSCETEISEVSGSFWQALAEAQNSRTPQKNIGVNSLNQSGEIVMEVIAINGSPRKKWNTAMMLEKALEGAASKGAQTSLFHLYDLNYRGCISCFGCKKRNGASYGKCDVQLKMI